MFLQGMIIQSEATVKKYCEKRLSTIITNIDEICILAMIVCVWVLVGKESFYYWESEISSRFRNVNVLNTDSSQCLVYHSFPIQNHTQKRVHKTNISTYDLKMQIEMNMRYWNNMKANAFVD